MPPFSIVIASGAKQSPRNGKYEVWWLDEIASGFALAMTSL